MGIKVYQTLDQSNTLYVEELDETYHSRNGARVESMHVFIEMGLRPVLELKKNIRILEVGFGTGLNAILTLQESEKISPEAHIDYHTVETYPLPPEIIGQLHYESLINRNSIEAFAKMHAEPWETTCMINDHFSITKYHTKLQDFTPSQKFDLIYFDAFAPDKQPELWQIDIFANLFLWLNLNGILVTYSSKGEVKRTLKQVGFEVQRLPGPPMKRHMLRAIKK